MTRPRVARLFVFACVLVQPVLALELPATALSYSIDVSLEPATRELQGRESIRWRNPSPSRVVDRVPLHLYLNAFSHEDTTWMRRALGRRVTPEEWVRRFDDPWGWIEPRSIRQAGHELRWVALAPDDGNPFDRTLIEVELAEPVAPGKWLTLEIEFEARLPVTFARTGGFEDFFLVAQWFPKLSMFETVGMRGGVEERWNAHQFHGVTEFYAEFADFDVRIRVPSGWTVVATGEGGPEETAEGGQTRRYRFRQRAVHDFAFAAGSRMVALRSRHDPRGPGGPVEILLYTPRGTEHFAPRWRKAIGGALDVLGSRVGPYPYATLTAVFPPHRSQEAFGMEYPTLITGSTGDPIWDAPLVSGIRYPELVLTHEIAHQYFYGLVATNEFEEAFLDEGFTDYWGLEALGEIYAGEAGQIFGRPLVLTEALQAIQPDSSRELPPIFTRPSFLLPEDLVGEQWFVRPSATLRTLASLFGQSVVDRVFAAYFERWAFGHPGFEDFLEVAREVGGEGFVGLLLEAYTRTRSPDYRVESLETERWSAPAGRIVGAGATVEPGDEREGERRLAGLDPALLEDDRTIVLEVLDPGFGPRHEGRIERRLERTEARNSTGDERKGEEVYHLSEVRLAGPAWEHLPVEVLFLFADGTLLRESWDGRATFRDYRFLGRSPLLEVRIDPEGRIALDPDPVNNARQRDADDALVRDWSAWLVGLFQLLAEGISQCL